MLIIEIMFTFKFYAFFDISFQMLFQIGIRFFHSQGIFYYFTQFYYFLSALLSVRLSNKTLWTGGTIFPLI